MIKHFKPILILTICPIILLAQSNFSIGLNIGSDLSFMNIEKSNAKVLQEEGGIGIGYSIGFQAEYGFQNSLFLRSGFLYEQSLHRHLIKGLVFQSDFENKTTSSIRNDITISSIGIPLDLAYRFSTKNENLKILLGIGTILNLNLNNKSDGKILHEGIDNEDLSNVENTVDPSIISGVIFTGVEFGINKKLILSIEPHFKYTPNKFILYMFESQSETKFETGLTMRLRIK